MYRQRNLNLILGAVITALILGVAVMGFFWKPYDPNALDATALLASPSLSHPFGTDNFGRDILSRVIEGVSSTVLIAGTTVLIGAAAGIILGGFTGYFGGLPDEIIMRVSDIIMAFPSILLALVLISLTGSGKYNVITVLGILFIPSFTRVVRGEFVRRREMDYVHSARITGVRDLRIMFVHILPNIMTVFLRSMAIGFNNAVLAEAGMSYLGIGVQPPDASLGRMLSESQPYLFSAPWYAMSAGITIVLLILGFGLLSEGLEKMNNA